MKSIVQETVSEVMNPYVITVTPYASLSEAYELMLKNQIRRLLVSENKKELLGIITIKDILEAKPSDIKQSLSLDEIYQHLAGLTVSVAMNNKPITIYQTSTIGNAAELMLDNKIGGLPVVDSNKELVGLITESDIFRLIVKRWREENILTSGAHTTG